MNEPLLIMLLLAASGAHAGGVVPVGSRNVLVVSGADSLTESRRLFLVARRAFDAKQFEVASDSLTRAAEFNPNDTGVQLWLGNALAQQAMRASLPRQLLLSKRIREAWRRSISLDPQNVEARENLIAFYESVPAIAGGGREKAVAEARDMQVVVPYRGAIMLAGVSERGNDSSAALAAYAQAAHHPDDNDGRGFEGWLYSLSRFSRYVEVFAAVDARLRRSPNDAIALAYLARTSARSGVRPDDGLSALSRVVRMQMPSFLHFDSEVGFLVQRGRLLEEKGDLIGAAAAYRAALTKRPNDKSIEQHLARVTRA